MITDMIMLSQRVIACKKWKWLPGMQVIWPNGNLFRVGQTSGINDGWDLPNYPSNGWGDDYPDRKKGLPDLTDPATLGCILFLVREHWGPHAITIANGFEEPQEVWSVHDGRFSEMNYGHEISRGATEAEALIIALESAP
jgi:hypothetical protein